MTDKLNALLRKHRQLVFATGTAASDRHARALRRLKQTRTFRDYCAANRERAAHRRGQRLLSLYA